MASEGKNVMVQGRIVWVSGDLFQGKIKTEFGSQIPKLNQQGQQVKEYGFGLAVPKSLLAQAGAGQPGEIWAAMHEEAYTLFPSRQIPPSFAMKYKDGDTIDDKGVPFSQREGYAGCIVLACSTSIPIKFFKFENGQNFLINEGIKCGDYVNVQLSVKAHPAIGAGKAGLYMSPNAVQFLGFGKEIINAPSGDQIFGNQAPPLPPGASAVPFAPQGMLVPTQAPVTPNYGVLPTPFQPQAPQQAAPSIPAPQGAPVYQNSYPSSNPNMPPLPFAPR